MKSKMCRVYLSLIIIDLMLMTAIMAQLELCPDGIYPAVVDLKWRTIPSRSEIMTELVTRNEVMELSQTFSTQLLRTLSLVNTLFSFL